MCAQIIFWIAAAAVLYTYAGYPLALLALRLVIRRPVRPGPIQPFVSLIIPAYNEAGVLERKLRNTLELDYPAGKMEIIVASDGSNDETAAIARQFAGGGRVRVLAFPRNRGKMATLNASVLEARGEIVVFSDASALLHREALRRLVETFADPHIGAASGRYTVVRAADVSMGASEDLYWKYETFLKVRESELDSLGGHGHLCAIRRALYPYPAANVVNDDFVILVSVLAKGYRAVYEPSAIVYEDACEMTGFGRRIRIVAGNIQQLREIQGLLRPFRPLPVFFFVSHKLGRLFAPLAMLAALVANLCLMASPLYRTVFCAQAVFYLLAAWGAVWRMRPKILMLPFYFSMINAAAFFGFYYALIRRRGMAWE